MYTINELLELHGKNNFAALKNLDNDNNNKIDI